MVSCNSFVWNYNNGLYLSLLLSWQLRLLLQNEGQITITASFAIRPGFTSLVFHSCFVFVCFCITQFSRSDHKCMFREEESDNHYMTYESFYNPGWSIGFSRRGRPLTHHHNNSSQHRHHHRRKNKKQLKESTRKVTVEKLERSAAASSSWSSTSQSSSTSIPSTSSSLSSHFSSTSHYHSSHSLSRSPHSTHKGKCYQFVKRPESWSPHNLSRYLWKSLA